MELEPRYFMAIFGEAHADTAPVEGNHYGLRRKYWPSEYIPWIKIAKGDIVLLYCTKSYLKHSEAIPGIGVVCCVKEGSDMNTMWYRYLPLTWPIDKNTICNRLSPKDLEKFKNLHPPFRRLFVIQKNSARSVLKGHRIDWP
ncbi:MAG: hypothetical protein KAW00_01845 [Dehalococcoidia bacterium]|nr:hypothetical protein [Dehalococcoidia bacterium]